MVDAEAEVRSYLRDRGELVELVGRRIYADVDLPKKYRPEDGPAVLFSVRGGGVDYSSKILQPSMNFRCYGENATVARNVYMALFDVLQDAKAGRILMARQEVQGQLVREAASGFVFVFAVFGVWVRNG